MEENNRFRKELTGLEKGKEYAYKIENCDESRCEQKSGAITTSGDSQASPITGNIVYEGAGLVAGTIQKSLSLLIYGLLGAVAVVVAGRIAYQAIQKDPMEGLLKKANESLESDEYHEAYTLYSEARRAYSELEEEAKLKHYDSLLKIYDSLKRHAEMKEAQMLAEKYTQGSITVHEVKRLNELLAK